MAACRKEFAKRTFRPCRASNLAQEKDCAHTVPNHRSRFHLPLFNFVHWPLPNRIGRLRRRRGISRAWTLFAISLSLSLPLSLSIYIYIYIYTNISISINVNIVLYRIICYINIMLYCTYVVCSMLYSIVCTVLTW